MFKNFKSLSRSRLAAKTFPLHQQGIQLFLSSKHCLLIIGVAAIFSNNTLLHITKTVLSCTKFHALFFGQRMSWLNYYSLAHVCEVSTAHIKYRTFYLWNRLVVIFNVW